MTITGGVAANGGGVNNAGRLTLERDEIAHNRATDANPSRGGDGGGIYSTDPDTGSQLIVIDSEIVGNNATSARGGIWARSYASPRIDNDLIYGNVVVDTTGGGADQGGGVWYQGDGPKPGDSWVGSNAMYEDTIVSNQILSAGPTGSPVGKAAASTARASGSCSASTRSPTTPHSTTARPRPDI